MQTEKTNSAATRTYVTTERAGWRVAGCVVPGNGAEVPAPKVGHDLELTDAQAEYELAQGTIELKGANKAIAKALATPSKAD